jgi:single-stranded-DNA-specific exonuclease
VASGERLSTLLLAQRGVALGQENIFFEPNFERDIHDPAKMSGMTAAVERIVRSASKQERILVYGDYDADGITGTALLVSTLRELGVAVLPYLPHRLEDGYGLNGRVLDRLAPEFDVLISVDCGVSNAAEIARLGELNKDVIVVDHHTLPDPLPPALAILHPGLGTYPFAHLSGVGVAWKLAQALLRDSRLGGADRDREKWLLDLCCLGTVADMVPLTGENRAIASFGFEVLRRTKRPGLRLLVDAALQKGQSVDAELISFRVAPLLNAAGRMDHAQPALDLLLTSQPDRARELINRLRRLNEARRTESQRVQVEAEERLISNEPVVFAYSEGWQAGVVGLVAGRLSEKFARPAVVIGNGGSHAIGSVRAPAGFNVMKMLTAVQQHMLTLGGHASAAGFSVAHEQVPQLHDALVGGGVDVTAASFVQVTGADALVSGELLDWDTVGLLERFEPYGERNARPRFVLREAMIDHWRPVGKAQDHAKINFRVGAMPIEGIGFGLAKDQGMRDITDGMPVDVLFHLDVNEYKGRRSLQLIVRDVAPAGQVRIEEEPARDS